jgi:hypothetical protein
MERSLPFLSIALVSALATPSLSAAPLHKNPFVRGVIYGKILDASGKPVGGATVALYNRTNKVLSWARTDPNGCYCLAANTKLALDIKPSKNRGLLMRCCNAAQEVVMTPVRAVANMVANPGLTVAAAGVSVASGTPAPLEAQAIAASVPNHETVVQTQLAAQGAAAAQALGVGPLPPPTDQSTEGQAYLAVEAPGFKKADVKANAYWLEPPADQNGLKMGLQAWVDTVQLAPETAKQNAVPVPDEIKLISPTISSSLVPAGSDVHLTVRVQAPASGNHPIRVFAREYPRNIVVELFPGKDKDVYEGDMHIDRLCSLGDATICIGALRAKPVEVKLDTDNNDAFFRFVKRLEDMQAGKPYGYDPMIMASQNRAEIKLTVLSPKTETPAGG